MTVDEPVATWSSVSPLKSVADPSGSTWSSRPPLESYTLRCAPEPTVTLSALPWAFQVNVSPGRVDGCLRKCHVHVADGQIGVNMIRVT